MCFGIILQSCNQPVDLRHQLLFVLFDVRFRLAQLPANEFLLSAQVERHASADDDQGRQCPHHQSAQYRYFSYSERK